MATIVGDKIKLTNYTYQLSLAGDAIEETTSGTRGEIEKVIDAFDIDWRPYAITYSMQDTLHIGGVDGSWKKSYDIAFSYQILDFIGMSYSYALYSGTYEGHYMPRDRYGNYATEGNDNYVEGSGRYIKSVISDGKGHLTQIEEGTFSNATAKHSSTSYIYPFTNTPTYVTATYLDSNGQLSYSYSSVRHTNYGAGKDDNAGMYKPTYIVANVGMTISGAFVYTYVDGTMNTGSYTDNTSIVGFTDRVKVVTGIEENSYGQVSYSYTYLYTTHSGVIGHDIGTAGSPQYVDFLKSAEMTADGVLVGEFGTFTTTNNGENNTYTNGEVTTTSTYIIGAYLDNTGKLSYTYGNVNHTTTGTQGANIMFGYSYSTASERVLTGVNIDAAGNLTYTFSPIRIRESETAAYLTYIAYRDIGNRIGDKIVNNIYLDETQHGLLTFTYSDLKMNYSDTADKNHITPDYTITDTNHIDVLVGINQESNGKVSYAFRNINTTHTNNGTTLSNNHTTNALGNTTVTVSTAGDNGVINNIHLTADGDLSYTYADLSVNGGYAGVDHHLNTTGMKVLTGVTQSPSGQITYTYNYIYTTHSGVVGHDIGAADAPQFVDFVKSVELTADGVIVGEFGTFGHNTDEIKLNNTTLRTGSYITGATIDKNGKLCYTYADVNHTTTPTKAADYSLTKEYTYLLTGVNIDVAGNLTYTYQPINVGNSAEAETLTYLERTMFAPSLSTYSVTWLEKRDSDGRVQFTYTDLSTGLMANDKVAISDVTITNSTKTQIVENIYQFGDGKIAYTYRTLNTTHENHGYGETQHKVITNVNLTPDGVFSYEVTDNTVVDTDGHRNAIVVDTASDGKTDHTKFAMSSAEAQRFITGITQDADGKITYSYTAMYNDRVGDYIYHDFNVNSTTTALNANPTTAVVPVLCGIATTNGGNSFAHLVSYETVNVATKHYVDNLMQANDIWRWCGTFKSDASGNLSLTHNVVSGDSGIAHGTTPDTSIGAVYKASEACVVNGVNIQAGDWIISVKDNASSTNLGDGWATFQGNLNIRQIATALVNGDNSKYVLTNLHIDDTGELSYNYSALDASNIYSGNNGIVRVNSANDILTDTLSTSSKGATVVTGVSLSQDGLNTILTYSTTSLYADQNHHTNTNATNGTATSVLGNVNISANGTLTYTYVDIATTTYHYATNNASSGTYGNAVDANNFVVPANGNTLNVSGNPCQIISSITNDNLGHITDIKTTTITHGAIDYTSTKTFGGGQSTEDSTEASNNFNFGGTTVITGFVRDMNGHIGKVGKTVITDQHIHNYTGANGVTYYLAGVNAQDADTAAYTTSNVYIKSGDLYVDSNARVKDLYVSNNAEVTGNLTVKSNTTLGDAPADNVTFKSKTIIIDRDSTPTLMSFENLDLLWGSLT